MTTTQIQHVQNHMKKIINFLEPHFDVAHFHMVEFFTKSGLNALPTQIRNEITENGAQNTIDAIFDDSYDAFPSLKAYCDVTRSLTLNGDICWSYEELQEELSRCGASAVFKVRLKCFVTEKKSHEVEMLSGVAAALKKTSETSHLVDIGDGKGYLSSLLALQYRVPVLGVDASKTNTDGAVDRARKFTKFWKKNTENSNEIDTMDLYKQVTRFVDEKTDFHRLIGDVFLQEPSGIGLIGLHTCGDLSATSFKIFTTNPHVKSICNVGCCYHLLTERGFPLSAFLKHEKFDLGRSARMIASQSIERVRAKRELPSETLFFRALFETILQSEVMSPQHRNVGKFRKPCRDFVEYVKSASKRVGLVHGMSEDEIRALCEDYEGKRPELNAFYLIRNMLSPVIETLILLDRLLFLYEQGYENSRLVRFFDPVVSPRCYGVISIK